MLLAKDQAGIYLSPSNGALSYPEEGNDFFYELEDVSFWFNHRNKIIEAVLNRFPFSGSFADIGGGNGFQVQYLADKFPDHTFHLVEPSYSGCRNARKRGINEVYCMGYEEFPFEEKNVGGIGLFDVIEHIEDDEDFLLQLKNRTAKGTLLYLTTPAFQSLWSDVDDYSGHFRRYTIDSISETLAKAGWKVQYASYFYRFLPPLVWLLRCLPYKIRGKRPSEVIRKSEEKHHNGSKIEKLLTVLHGSETRNVQKGSMNFGSSVFIVASNG